MKNYIEYQSSKTNVFPFLEFSGKISFYNKKVWPHFSKVGSVNGGQPKFCCGFGVVVVVLFLFVFLPYHRHVAE